MKALKAAFISGALVIGGGALYKYAYDGEDRSAAPRPVLDQKTLKVACDTAAKKSAGLQAGTKASQLEIAAACMKTGFPVVTDYSLRESVCASFATANISDETRRMPVLESVLSSDPGLAMVTMNFSDCMEGNAKISSQARSPAPRL